MSGQSTDTMDAAPAAVGAEDGPRTRWAGIVWGLGLGAVGVLALKAVLTPQWRAAIVDWTLQVTPLTVVSSVQIGRAHV